MKTKRIVATILVLTLCTSILTACGKKHKPVKSETETPVTEEHTTNKGTTNTANNKKESTEVTAFANALCDEDYEAILDMLYLPENSIVSPTNIKEFLQSSNLTDFLGSDYIKVTKTKYNRNKTAVAATIALKDNQTPCTVMFKMNADKNMVLGMSKAYEERTVIMPGDAIIRASGPELNTEYAEPYEPTNVPHGLETGLVKMKIICPVTDFDVYVMTKLHDYNLHIQYNNDLKQPYNFISYELPTSISDTACEQAKTLINNMIANTVDEKPIDEFFSNSASPELKKHMIEWIQKYIIKGTLVATPDLRLQSVSLRETEDTKSYIADNKTLHLYVTYTSVWSKTFTHTGETQFLLELEDGTYHIKWTDLYQDTFINNNLS